MFLRSGNSLLTFLLTYHVWGPQKFKSPSGSRGFRGYPSIRSSTKMLWIYKQSRKRFIVNFIVMSCHVKQHEHVMSCHGQNMSWSCPVMSCHVMPCHATLCNVMPCHATSHHVKSLRKSRDDQATNALLSTDFFVTQLIQIRHNRVYMILVYLFEQDPDSSFSGVILTLLLPLTHICINYSTVYNGSERVNPEIYAVQNFFTANKGNLHYTFRLLNISQEFFYDGVELNHNNWITARAGSSEKGTWRNHHACDETGCKLDP